jgi:hypothetical protein
MKRVLILGLLVSVAAGCSTAGDVMKASPTMTVSTQKSADAYMGCLAPKVTAEWSLSKVVPQTGGQILIVSGSVVGTAIAAVDVKDEAGGATVRLRKGAATDMAVRTTADNVKSCL